MFLLNGVGGRVQSFGIWKGTYERQQPHHPDFREPPPAPTRHVEPQRTPTGEVPAGAGAQSSGISAHMAGVAAHITAHMAGVGHRPDMREVHTFRIPQGPRARVAPVGCRVQGVGCGVQGAGCRV